jgi:DNA (cytosine-5)-methyltransferase 1
MNELALFAGAGGGILGGKLLGWRTACAVEIERHARLVLLARQNDGILEPFPIWDDVRTFDGRQWRGLVDVVSGGFPCQDVSVARAMWGRAGLDGERSGLWREMLRIISEIRPAYVFGENSPALRTNGLDQIIAALTSIGYDCRWITLGAESVGLNHKRHRIWFYAADTHREGLERHSGNDPGKEGRQDEIGPFADVDFRSCTFCGYIYEQECGAYGCANCEAEGPGGSYDYGTGLLPRIAGMGHGMADWLDRIKAVGNGQVPAVAALAWEILSQASNPENNTP